MGGLIALILSGIPIAVALLISGAAGLWLLDFPMLIVLQRFTAGAESFVLLAIPFFILTGAIMDAGGISRRLIAFCDSGSCLAAWPMPMSARQWYLEAFLVLRSPILRPWGQS